MTRLSVLGALALAALLGAGWMIFVYAPTEVVQGNVQRIFYLHVPSAIAAYGCFALVFGGGIAYLWKDSLRADRLARSGAAVGLVFTSVTLLMGSLWAKPIWGTFWVWDARLTSTLVLWLVYAGYLLARRLASPGRQAAGLGAVVGILGFIDVPVVHFSVSWWRTFHPPLDEASSANLPLAMWVTLMVSLVAVAVLAATLVALRYQVELLAERAAQRNQRRLRAAA